MVKSTKVAVPPFDQFFSPVLRAIVQKPGAHWKDHYALVAFELGLTDEDLLDVTPKLKKPRAWDRTEWAIAYLRAAKIIQQAGRGRSVITPRGEELFRHKPENLKIKDLLQFEEFRQFFNPKSDEEQIGAGAQNPVEEVSESPAERMDRAYHEQRAALAADLSQRLLCTSPSRFEQIIVDLMLKLGYGGTGEDAGKVVGKVGDGGIDGIIKQDRLGLDNIYLQAKRWQNSVGTQEINSFIGALTTRGASKGVLITTSTFTQAAKQVAAGAPHLKLSLIDGEELARLMIDFDLGVSAERTFIVRRIDSDYFGEE